ncbi:MAG: GDP-mannose 4,6-dehydratase [Deltaproteobacteria bacterium]|nr:GDP-mannose 4,6-dehydratase [Deltaproteobacteria bacterium]MBW1924848.1 GDP-mannose 4,6-dehydratase [Deltaproteobacteria bacterium]MBW1950492.1 GDP-mannose 4,6-dehydratase [Deltaproteobacteria bacterium]MBW2008071.1 GDP-mannose 4,6-dehydratase [Deltaproteobacteria bacterium]RLB35082.1 MAG: nucleoside-diphosphate sugar epimerase [Deltaproteobacteria bacterium]
MKSLITGGAGFIGSHLAEALIAGGQEVFVIDNLWTGELKNISSIQQHERFHLVVDTILNESVMNELVFKVDHIYHLAAAVGVKTIMDHPVETLDTNVKGTEVVLRLANRFKKKVFIASTSEVYGKHVEHTLSEDDNRVMGSVKKRRWAYACSKTLDEFLALAYFDEKKLPVVVGRLFNTVGPRQTGRYGMVLPTFVQSALLGKPITVFGDGNQTRSFTHVLDVVQAVTRLMEEPAAEGEVFNVGNDHEVSILDLARVVKEMTGSDSKIELIPYEKAYGPGFEDMERRCPNLDKIRRVIGFEPKYDLEAIVRSVIEYFKS